MPASTARGRSLRGIAVVMRHQHIGDPVDPEVAEPVEDRSVAEVDGDRVATPPDHIDVRRVGVAKDVLGDAHRGIA